MINSYNKVTKGLKSETPKNQAKTPIDIITEVIKYKSTVIIDTPMELSAELGNKNDPNDTPEEIEANRFTP